MQYVYDQLGRLVVAYDLSGNAAVYHYDAVGNLLSITSDSATQFTLTNLNQSSGSSGATVIIYGTDFQSCTTLTVTFNGVAATSVQVVNSTEIQATVPSGATTGEVVVTCNGTALDAGIYTIGSSAPSIASFTPTVGTAGTAVAINGSNFQATASEDSVSFASTPAPVTSATTTTIGTAVPSGVTTSHISVTTSAGQDTSSGYFFVPPSPATASNMVTGQIHIGGQAVDVTATSAEPYTLLAFDGTAGQQVSLNITNWGMSGSVGFYLIAPGGNTSNALDHVDTNTRNIIADVTLPTTGTYTVFVDPDGTNTGTATIQLSDTTSDVPIDGLSIGGPAVTPADNSPGQDFSGTFSGTAGQQISLELTNPTFSGTNGHWATYYIIPPGGNTTNAIASLHTDHTSVIADVTLPNTGTYTLFIDPDQTNSGGTVTLQLFATNDADISSTVNVSDTYAQTILADLPEMYWRLDETGPDTAANAAPRVKYGVTGPTSPDTAITLGGYAAYVSTAKQFSSPSTYSVGIWFKTATTSGGRLIGFGNHETGASTTHDRHIYMTDSGQLVFGHYAGAVVTVTSPASYNDGFWHYAVGSFNGSTLVLYVDGGEVGSASSGAPQSYSGYWRIGYDNISNWPSAPTSDYFQGSIGEAAVYSTALTATQVANHYAAAGTGNYDSTVLADSPTSYWKLNESPGPTLADATGGGNTGTAIAESDNGSYEGGVTYSQPGSISTDNAVSFDGSTGLVESVLAPPIGSTNASIEAWVYIPSSWTPASGSYSSVIQAGTNDGIGFGIGYNYQGTTGFRLFGLYEYVRWIPLSNPPALATNTWYHLVMTVDSSGVPTFYINGTAYAQASSGSAPKTPTGNLYVGNDPAASGRFFGGTIDEVAVYDYALSAAQVANHYSASGR